MSASFSTRRDTQREADKLDACIGRPQPQPHTKYTNTDEVSLQRPADQFLFTIKRERQRGEKKLAS